MKYVLILVMYAGNGPVVTHIDFKTVDTCNAALNSMVQAAQANGQNTLSGGCYLK